MISLREVISKVNSKLPSPTTPYKTIPLTALFRCLRQTYYEAMESLGRIEKRPATVTVPRLLVTQVLGKMIHEVIEEAVSGLYDCLTEPRIVIPLGNGYALVAQPDLVCFERIGEEEGWVVVEIKTIGYIKVAPRVTHLAQLKTYMLLTGSKRGLLWYIDRRNGETKEIIVEKPLPYSVFKEILSRARMLCESIEEGRPPEPEPGPWCSTCRWSPHCPLGGRREVDSLSLESPLYKLLERIRGES